MSFLLAYLSENAVIASILHSCLFVHKWIKIEKLNNTIDEKISGLGVH
jgi:hypothetical protein